MSRNYLRGRPPSTLHELVTKLLTGAPKHHAAFMTLNYDDFLEQALRTYGGTDYQFTGMGQYVQVDRRAKVFKIHGSIDWVAPFGNKSSTWEAEVRTLDEPVEAMLDRADVAKSDFDRMHGQGTAGN